MVKGYSSANHLKNFFDGIANGTVTPQNYEEILKNFIKDPNNYALVKKQAEDAFRYRAGLLNKDNLSVPWRMDARFFTPPSVLMGSTSVPVINLSNPPENSLNAITDSISSKENDMQSGGYITDGTNTLSVDSAGNISGSGSTSGAAQPVKKQAPVAVAPKGLQKITTDISTTSSEQPRTNNILDAPMPTSAPAVPVQPVETPIDESYYRYLRNNGWNDFDARRQAIRYY